MLYVATYKRGIDHGRSIAAVRKFRVLVEVVIGVASSMYDLVWLLRLLSI